MIMYDYDSNNTLGEAIKSRTGDEILRVFTKKSHTIKTMWNHTKVASIRQ